MAKSKLVLSINILLSLYTCIVLVSGTEEQDLQYWSSSVRSGKDNWMRLQRMRRQNYRIPGTDVSRWQTRDLDTEGLGQDYCDTDRIVPRCVSLDACRSTAYQGANHSLRNQFRFRTRMNRDYNLIIIDGFNRSSTAVEESMNNWPSIVMRGWTHVCQRRPRSRSPRTLRHIIIGGIFDDTTQSVMREIARQDRGYMDASMIIPLNTGPQENSFAILGTGWGWGIVNLLAQFGPEAVPDQRSNTVPQYFKVPSIIRIVRREEEGQQLYDIHFLLEDFGSYRLGDFNVRLDDVPN